MSSNNIIRVAVSGACGRMGQEVVKAVVDAPDMELVGAIDKFNAGQDIGNIIFGKPLGILIEEDLEAGLKNKDIDVVVDFTDPGSVFANAQIILNSGARPVIGTTGLEIEQINKLKKLSEEKNLGLLIAPNFTIGAVLMMKFAEMAAKYFENAEIIELHHNKKKDAPSGTAVKTAQMMEKARNEFGTDNVPEIELIEGSRGGTTESGIHIHSVRLPGYVASQEVLFGSAGQVLKIRHDSIDRTCYMPGVLLGIRHSVKNNDFVYGLEHIL